MKHDLLSFQIGDQLSGAVNRDLIAYRQQHPAIPLNPFINLDALLTHHIPPLSGGELPCHLLNYDSRNAILFPRQFRTVQLSANGPFVAIGIRPTLLPTERDAGNECGADGPPRALARRLRNDVVGRCARSEQSKDVSSQDARDTGLCLTAMAFDL